MQHFSSTKRTCMQCGETIRGRRDKKFCNDQCRNDYNNFMNSDRVACMRNTNGVLRRNRKILESILQSFDNVKIPLRRIIDAGYQPDHLTQVQTTNIGTYRYCYEYGIMMMEENMVMIVKRDGY
jgi:hypothetical protein